MKGWIFLKNCVLFCFLQKGGCLPFGKTMQGVCLFSTRMRMRECLTLGSTLRRFITLTGTLFISRPSGEGVRVGTSQPAIGVRCSRCFGRCACLMCVPDSAASCSSTNTGSQSHYLKLKKTKRNESWNRIFHAVFISLLRGDIRAYVNLRRCFTQFRAVLSGDLRDREIGLDYFQNVRNNVSLIINRHLLITLFAWRCCDATVGV